MQRVAPERPPLLRRVAGQRAAAVQVAEDDMAGPRVQARGDLGHRGQAVAAELEAHHARAQRREARGAGQAGGQRQRGEGHAPREPGDDVERLPTTLGRLIASRPCSAAMLGPAAAS